MEKKLKSPLRYPGGKTRAIKILDKYIPDGTTEICSPFFGGGSFEIHLANRGIKVHGYDAFKPLVSFWDNLLSPADFKLYCLVENEYPMTKERFYQAQKELMVKDGVEQGALFYVLNRCSFSGSTISGGMSPNTPRFKEHQISRLTDYHTLRNSVTVKNYSFNYSIPKHDCLIFADPPYFIPQQLYGNKGDMHRDFDHKLLASMLMKRGNFILTYNDCPEIRELYKGCKFDVVQWSYGMNKSKKSNEVIITLA